MTPVCSPRFCDAPVIPLPTAIRQAGAAVVIMGLAAFAVAVGVDDVAARVALEAGLRPWGACRGRP